VTARPRNLAGDALLEQVLAEVRALRADVRRVLRVRAAPDLVAALRVVYVPGISPFTAEGVLTLAAEDPHGELSCALAAFIDMDLEPRARAVSLGMRLSKLPDLEVVGRSGGLATYRLRDLDLDE
jgi:hypothetical protein